MISLDLRRDVCARLTCGFLTVALCIILPTSASEPASHDVTVPTSGGHTVTVEWTAVSPAGANPTSACSGDGVTDDQHVIHLTVPEGTYDNVNVTATFRIEWDDGSQDLILSVAHEGGFESSDGGDPSEVVSVTNPVAGDLKAFVCSYLANADTPVRARLTLSAQAPGGAACNAPDAASGSTSSGSSIVGTRISAGFAQDLARLAASDRYGAIVHFGEGTPAEHRSRLQSLGLAVAHDFEQFAQAVYAVGPVSGFRALVDEPSVSYLEAVQALKYMGDTHAWATRARVAQEAVSGGPYLVNGTSLRGEGVGIAIVDSGVNTPHPDLVNRTVKNFKVTCPNPVPSEDNLAFCQLTDLGTTASSDTTGGHGTHVAGIALGDGTASDGFADEASIAPNVRGTYTGIAPGASLYAFGAGEGLSILTVNAAASFDWILKNNPSLDVKIRAVSNSYGGDPGPHNPDELLSKLARQLVGNGVTVLFAASNDGGNGTESTTSPYCRNPDPGVICVANYDDGQIGSLSGGLNSSSSRGQQGIPGDYPDIAAPGTLITATCTQPEPGQTVCTSAEMNWQPYYGTISGTSMATPHMAGVVALIAQARAELTPAEVERLLKRTARKVASNGEYEVDPCDPQGSVNFGFGAGLANVPGALDALGVTKTGMPSGSAETAVFDADADPGIPGAADVVRLTAQETSMNGSPGILYRLTVRDIADIAAGGLNYRLSQSVNGVRAVTSLGLGSAGELGIPGAGPNNSAVAASAVLEGNVISFFVPSSALEYPPVGAPVHNIRVSVFDASGSALDFAPSPADVPASVAEVQPMFGKPFTVVLPGGKPPVSTETPCLAPGITMIKDRPGDVNNGLPSGQDDLMFTAISEIGEFDNHLVFTIKVDNLDPAPTNYRWITYFLAPNGTEYWVGMSTSEGITQFNYGTSEIVDNPAAPARRYFVEGTLDPASNYKADGTITLVLDKSKVGLVTGHEIKSIVTSIRQSSPDSAGAAGLTVDSGAASQTYTLVGNDTCRQKGAAGEIPSGSGVFLGGALGVPTLLVLAFGGLAGVGFRVRWRAAQSHFSQL